MTSGKQGPSPAVHRFNMVMTAEDLAALDRFRRGEPDIPSRSEAVRRLIHRAAGERSDQ